MNILRFFESKKNMKICSKTHQITPFKKNFLGKHAPEPPSKRLATPCVAQYSVIHTIIYIIIHTIIYIII